MMPRSRALPAGLLLAGGLLFCLTYLVYRPLSLDIGGPVDDDHTQGFYQREVDPRRRYLSLEFGRVQPDLAGAGIAPFTVALQASSGREAGSPPLPITVTAQGQPLTVLTLTNDSRLYTITVPAGGVNALSGDLVSTSAARPTCAPATRGNWASSWTLSGVTPVGPVLARAGAQDLSAAQRGAALCTGAAAGLARLGGASCSGRVGAGRSPGCWSRRGCWLTVFSARLLALLVLAHIMLTVVALGHAGAGPLGAAAAAVAGHPSRLAAAAQPVHGRAAAQGGRPALPAQLHCGRRLPPARDSTGWSPASSPTSTPWPSR